MVCGALLAASCRDFGDQFHWQIGTGVAVFAFKAVFRDGIHRHPCRRADAGAALLLGSQTA